jgi:hypothetical protein
VSARELAVDAVKMLSEKDAQLEKFEKREPLVQEVIRAYKTRMTSANGLLDVHKALLALSEWTP